MTDYVEKVRGVACIRNDLWRCVLAEFFCTAFFLFGGTSASAQAVLSGRASGEYVCIAIGWSLALVFPVYAGFYISGSHLNPAVSLAWATLGRLPWIRVPLYSVAQILGGFVGAACTFAMYYDAIDVFDGGVRAVGGPNGTAGIFATYPADHVGAAGAIIDQLLGTAYLCMAILAITEERNKVASYIQPFLIGMVVLLIGVSFGLNHGYAINPARDLGPRLLTLCVGYGTDTFSFRGTGWFLIPTIVPLLGAVLGSWIYQLAIGIHVPDEAMAEKTATAGAKNEDSDKKPSAREKKTPTAASDVEARPAAAADAAKQSAAAPATADATQPTSDAEPGAKGVSPHDQSTQESAAVKA